MDSRERTSHTPPPSSPSPSGANLHSQSPSPANTSSTLQTLFFDAVEAANPPLRQLVSQSTMGSLPGASASDFYVPHRSTNRPQHGSAFNEHMHTRRSCPITNRHRYHFETGSTTSGSSSAESTSGASTTAIKSGRYGYLWAKSDSSSSQRGHSDTSLTDGEESGNEGVTTEKTRNDDVSEKREEREGEDNPYPRPLALTLIIIGLCLSVFLTSLDRTIITTVRIQSPI